MSRHHELTTHIPFVAANSVEIPISHAIAANALYPLGLLLRVNRMATMNPAAVTTVPNHNANTTLHSFPFLTLHLIKFGCAW